MTSFVLAEVSPVTNSLPVNEEFVRERLDLLLYGGIAGGIALVILGVFGIVVLSVWLGRSIRHWRKLAQSAMQPADDPMQQIADARAHLDASKRHIAALGEKLDQIQDQLKRRPLS